MTTSGDVPEGWTRRGWADYLLYLADRCEALHPSLAAAYRGRVKELRDGREVSVEDDPQTGGE